MLSWQNPQMLFDATKHETLTRTIVQDSKITAAIDRIRADTEAADQGDRFWREHPCERD